MDGIIVINKEKEYTSHDVVAIVKKYLGEKVGHTGTLDPNATGVLPLLIGKGTKISKYLVEHDKVYEVTIFLGKKTDTADSEGNVIEEKEVSSSCFEKEIVQSVLQSFLGKQKQTPPIYSAIKVKGKKLYEYARSGKDVEIPVREIEIFDICLNEIRKKEQEICFKVHCSKGTYIRTLCEDVSEKLGTIGYMKELNRTSVGRFKIEQAITINELKDLNKEELEKRIIQMEDLFQDCSKLQLNEKLYNLFLNGVLLNPKELGKEELEDGIYRIYTNGEFIGIGLAKGNLLKRDVVLKENVD